jgi:hypothetical protein
MISDFLMSDVKAVSHELRAVGIHDSHFTSHVHHSVLKLFTGFANAAFID